MGSEKKAIPSSCLSPLTVEMPLPNHNKWPNVCKVQHPQTPYLWMGNAHHGQITSREVAALVESPHHAEVLKHYEDIPYATPADIADQVGSNFSAATRFTYTCLGR